MSKISDPVKEVKKKVLTWLEEEGLSPEERTDPNAYFNFNIKVAGQSFHVIQGIRRIDSIVVVSSLKLTPDRLNLMRNSMNEKKRQEFFWNLRLALLRNNELGDFNIEPNPPNDVKGVFISSRPIFYESLSKDRLMFSVQAVFRATLGVIWMLEMYAGAITPKEGRPLFYV